MATFTNTDNKAFITGTSDADIINAGYDATVYSGDGSDQMTLYGSNSYVNAGNGNNRVIITTSYDNNTVFSGSGSDYVSIAGSSIELPTA